MQQRPISRKYLLARGIAICHEAQGADALRGHAGGAALGFVEQSGPVKARKLEAK